MDAASALGCAGYLSVLGGEVAASPFGLDLLLGDLVGDLRLLGHGVLGQAHTLHGDGLLLHDRPLLVQGHLMLDLGQFRPARRLAHVRVGD